MSTFRNQMRVKCKLNVAERVNQLGSCEDKDGVEGQRPCKLTLFGPQHYTVRSYLGSKFTAISKNLFSMNQLINLLHTLQLLALTRHFSLTGNHYISALYLFFWSVFSRIRTKYSDQIIHTLYLSLFTPNAGKYGPEKQIQCRNIMVASQTEMTSECKELKRMKEIYKLIHGK